MLKLAYATLYKSFNKSCLCFKSFNYKLIEDFSIFFTKLGNSSLKNILFYHNKI